MKIKLNEKLEVDLEKLIASKLLIQANSGGGKSWLIRRLVEQAYGKVQIIILDPEGEFSTLREKFDFVLAGVGGDTPAESRSAALLARKLLELKVSTIIDLYELHPQERKHFVRLFFDAMVNAPKDLYHDVLVVLDEAHMFVPEKDQSESASAVIDMASRGRKRGYSLVLATQRISKLNKDAAAECNTKLIGRTSLDIDRKRAADELGITSKEDVLALRSLKPGEFFAFGPAISDEVIKVTIGDVQTSVPKAGRQFKVVPPTEGIKKILGQLADLPKEAEKELRTIAEFKKENTTLKRELTLVKSSAPKSITTKIEKVEVPMIGKRTLQKFLESEKLMRKMLSDFRMFTNNSIDRANVIEKNYNLLMDSIKKVSQPIFQTKEAVKPQHYVGIDMAAAGSKDKSMAVVMNRTPAGNIEVVGSEKLGRCEAMIYSFLFKYSNRPFNKRQIGAATGYSINSSGFTNALSKLSTLGLIARSGDQISLNELDESIAIYKNSDFSIKGWLNNLGKCPREIYELLLEHPDTLFTKEQIAESTPSRYSVNSSGFTNALSSLNSTGLIRREGSHIRLNPELLELN